jgi:hypothetical protein
MNWDAEVESPATIAIIGSGPTGIETALYGRFLGYDIMLFDAARPARHAKRWNERPIVATIDRLTTPLGWAALKAQDDTTSQPSDDTHWNGAQFESQYLTPLAKTDLIYDNVYFNSSVVSVGRLNHRRSDLQDLQARCNDEFYLTINSRDRGTYTARADVIVDCRNTSGRFTGLGPGGVPAIGQSDCEEQFLQYFPKDDRFERHTYDGKRYLVNGIDADAIRFINEFLQQTWCSTTNLLWLVRHQDQDTAAALLKSHFKDEAARQTLINIKPCLGIVSLHRTTTGLQVKILNDDDSTVETSIDVLVAEINHVFDDTLIKDALYIENSHSDMRWPFPASNEPNLTFTTTEPHYYVMQPLEYWQDAEGLISAHRQIRELYALLGARPDLNLYEVILNF